MADANVTFTNEIPKITREGSGPRKSKYNELLDAIRGRAESAPDKPTVAVVTLDSQSEATSRYTSVKGAASKRDDADNWTLAVRQQDGGKFGLFIKFDAPEAQAPAPKAPARKRTRKTAAK
jgi:hypothetical protein